METAYKVCTFSFTAVQYLNETMKLLQMGRDLAKLSLKLGNGVGTLLGQTLHLFMGCLFQGGQSRLTGCYVRLQGLNALLLLRINTQVELVT